MDQTQVKTSLQVAEEKIEAFKAQLQEKVFAENTLEEVGAAVDVAVAVLPRVKNYFTALDKCFKMLVNKTKVVVALTRYSIAHPEVSYQSLALSLKQASGVKVITDEKLLELLEDGTFPIVTKAGRTKATDEYDFEV